VTEATVYQGVRLRALLVDDYRPNIQTMGPLLRLLGCDVQACEDPRRAAELARALAPHVVFLDLAMPGMDGFAVARELRESLPMARLAAITGFGDAATRQRCEAAGFDHFLVKPAGLDEIRAVLVAVEPSS
jgi:CheY-like chemotaxis protein